MGTIRKRPKGQAGLVLLHNISRKHTESANKGYSPPPAAQGAEGFGKFHKSAAIVLAPLHTFLINNLLIFKNFSVIMYIQARAKPLPQLTSTSLSFSYLSFLFGRGPELTGHQHRASFDFYFLRKSRRRATTGRPYGSYCDTKNHPRCKCIGGGPFT